VTTNQIVPLILDALVTQITATCITAINEADPTKMDLVKLGRVREDVVNSNIHAAVSGGDPESPNYLDGILSLEEMDNIGYRFPIREIGGGQLWWRRGIVQIGCYFIKEKFDEETAADHAYVVLGRVQNAIPQTQVGGLTDSFGEQAIMIDCYGNTFTESGGPPASFIWRGKILWSCLTIRP